MSATKAKDLGSRKIADTGKLVRRKHKKHDRVEIVGQAGLDLYIVQHFLTADECAGIMELIDADAYPSTLYEGTEQAGFRTSYSCNLAAYHPLTMRIERRICDLMGLDPRHVGQALGKVIPAQDFLLVPL